MSDTWLTLVFWLAPLAFGLAFAGLAFYVIRSLGTGAGAYSSNMADEASRQLEDLFMFVPAKRIAEVGRVLAGVVFLMCAVPLFDMDRPLFTLLGLALGLFFGALALSLPNRVVLILKEKRRRKFNLQLVEALGSMSNALRAGFSINQAFEAVVQNGEKPIAQEFGVMLQQMRVGMNFYDALQSLDARVGSDDLTLVVTSIDIARRTGGNLTEIFDKISVTIRERMRIERRVQTLTAQGQLQGIIVASMPLILGVAMTWIKPELMTPFFKSTAGMGAIGITVLLVAVGWFFIKRIIKIDV